MVRTLKRCSPRAAIGSTSGKSRSKGPTPTKRRSSPGHPASVIQRQGETYHDQTSHFSSDSIPAAKAFVLAFATLASPSHSSLFIARAQDLPGKDGWIPLFNGKDLEGWKPKITGHDSGDNFGDTFRVEDGVLKVAYDQYPEFDGQVRPFVLRAQVFELPFAHEYRFVGDQCKGGPGWAFKNSGVMIHSQSPDSMRKDQDFPVSIEVQFFGGNGKDKRPTGNVCTPGTNIVMKDKLITQHCTDSQSKTYHGDEWVTVEVEVHGNGIIKHIIDGETVLEYEKPQLDDRDPDGRRLIKNGDKMLHEGYIALQSESHPIEFRKVEILPFGEK